MKKVIYLLFLLIITLTACSSYTLDDVYLDMNNIFSSYSSGFSSQITIGDSSYYYEQDINGNKHVIETVESGVIELYYIDEQYFVCNDICVLMTKDNLEEMYGDEYSIVVLQKVIDEAFEYHQEQYEYILSTNNSENEYDISVDESGVVTLVYPTSYEERQVIVVDNTNGKIVYNYDGKEEENVVYENKPELFIEVEVGENE